MTAYFKLNLHLPKEPTEPIQRQMVTGQWYGTEGALTTRRSNFRTSRLSPSLNSPNKSPVEAFFIRSSLYYTHFRSYFDCFFASVTFSVPRRPLTAPLRARSSLIWPAAQPVLVGAGAPSRPISEALGLFPPWAACRLEIVCCCPAGKHYLVILDPR
jgi:hypothetical protein